LLDRLRCGNRIEGPAVIEDDDTTLVLPEFARLNLDRYRNFIIELFP
jgi:N-methylhydantoinase A/oxoprolinase/acetone carboxylase beta subunit